MNKSRTIILIASGLVVLSVIVFGLNGTYSNIFNSSSTPIPESAQKNNTGTENKDTQANVSFSILKPAYVPDGYFLNKSEGARFKGRSSELEQALLIQRKMKLCIYRSCWYFMMNLRQ